MLPLLDVDALRRTSALFLKTAHKLSRHAPLRTDSEVSQPLAPPALTLVNPDPLAPQLIFLGLDEYAAHRIDLLVLPLVSQLKERLLATYDRRLQSLQSQSYALQSSAFLLHLRSTFSSVYSLSIKRWTDHILCTVAPKLIHARTSVRVAEARSTQGADKSGCKRPFNQDAIPRLEKFFEENAFPSRLEKYDLASLCEMDYKQIHVWFQNRRSRFRKDGKALKKREVKDRVLAALEQSVDKSLLPPVGPEEEDDSSIVEHTDSDHEADPRAPGFHLDAPPHAFPSPWPPVCPYDPFPVGDGRPAFEVRWLRTTLPSSVERPSAPDMADLVAAFSKLSIAEEQIHTSRMPRTVASGSHTRSSPHIGFTSPCLRAPHPALIRRPRGSLQCSRGFDERPDVRTPKDLALRGRRRGSHQPPETCAPSSPSCSPPPPPCTASGSNLQARRGLPRRVPKHLPLPRPSHVDTDLEARKMSTITRTSSLQSASSSDVDSPLPSPSFSAADSLPLVADTHCSKTDAPLCWPVLAGEDLWSLLSKNIVVNESWSDPHFPVQPPYSLVLS